MRNRINKFLLIVNAVILLAIFYSPAVIKAQTATAPSGSGTGADPYLIASLNNLYWVTQNPTSWVKYFKQTADIDASSSSNWNGGKGFSPIGTLANAFAGIYDGNGHTINGIYIKDASAFRIGLFGLFFGGIVKNLGVTNVNITGGNFVGGIVGGCIGGAIDNCYSTGTVIGDTTVGGIVGGGYAASNALFNLPFSMTGCHSDCIVEGKSTAGGIIGETAGYSSPNNISNITDSYSTGWVACSYINGGLIGRASLCKISTCYSHSTVVYGLSSNNTYDTGGLIAYADSSVINNCYCTFNSLLGIGDLFGGLVGLNLASTINNSYAVFSLTLDGGITPSTFHIGGLVGQNQVGHINNSFWDETASGLTYSDGGIGKTISQMKSSVTFLTAGWDPSIWYRDNSYNNGYPYLAWQKPTGTSLLAPLAPSGSGTSADPYQIASLNNLLWLSQDSSSWGSYFIQTSDIDASSTITWDSGAGFSPIGNSSKFFTGNYNGKGHTIDSMYINRPTLDRLGLFGTIAYSSIDSLGVTNLDINGGTGAVGGVLGVDRNSTISDCYSTGSITSNGSEVGGIVGYNNSSCTVSNCYSTVSISGSGSSYVGGLVGINYTSGKVSKCYATGLLSSSATDLGGFCGRNIGSITGSFWNTDTVATGIANGTTTGATGKTTAEMKTDSTYLNAGWSPSIWYKDNILNYGYPYLAWQNPSGTPVPVELTSFTATINENQVELKWKTATEVNNYGFEILRFAQNDSHSEHASAGEESTNWQKIGFVKGSGTSTSPITYSFVDDNPLYGNTEYKLKQENYDGTFKYSSIISINLLPVKFKLSQNYPNPFNPTTTINFALPVKSNVTLSVYNSLGQKVTDLVNRELTAGNHSVNFNASRLSSGVYIYRLEAVPLTGSRSSSAAFSQTKKMALLK